MQYFWEKNRTMSKNKENVEQINFPMNYEFLCSENNINEKVSNKSQDHFFFFFFWVELHNFKWINK